jgi:hypothetical protein
LAYLELSQRLYDKVISPALLKPNIDREEHRKNLSLASELNE